MIKYGSSKQSEKVKKKLQEQVSEGAQPSASWLAGGVYVCYECKFVCVCTASVILGGFSESSVENLRQEWEGETCLPIASS